MWRLEAHEWEDKDFYFCLVCFCFAFLAKNRRCNRDCPIKLLADCPGSVGGLGPIEAWSPGLWKQTSNGNKFKTKSFFLKTALQVCKSLKRIQSGRQRAKLLRLLHNAKTFISAVTLSQFLLEPSLSFASHAEEHVLKNLTGREPAGFKLSTKSKLYVHDMSEAALTGSVCLLSFSKAHCSFCISPSFTLVPLPREKPSVFTSIERRVNFKKK